MRLTFRPTRRYWLLRVVIRFLFYLAVSIGVTGLLAIDTISNIGIQFAVSSLIWLILAVLFVRNAALLAFHSVLYIDENGISGRIGKMTQFEVAWSTIIATWMDNRVPSNQFYLFLGTPEGVVSVPLALFDKNHVWEIVQSRVNPDALREEAHKKLPGYEDWMTLGKKLEKEIAVRPLCVTDNRVNAAFGWVILVFFTIMAVRSFLEGELILTFLFGILAAMGIALALSAGSLEMDIEAVTRIHRFGRYRMEWREIKWIEINPQNTCIVLHGDDKRLVIPGPKVWAGSDQEQMRHWFRVQIIRRQIDDKWSYWAQFKWSRNVRL
jgi:hypothetical protein